MSRTVVALCLSLLVVISAAAADGDRKKTEESRIATTAFIAKIDLNSRQFMVRSSETRSLTASSLAQKPPESTVRIDLGQGQNRGGILFPGGVTIRLPRSTPKQPTKAEDKPANPGEYTVIVTGATVLKGDEGPIEFTDFKIGDFISIHGTLSGTNLKATQIAKWPKY